MKANNKETILNMFEWSDFNDCYLSKLKLDGDDGSAGGTIQDKRFKHLCYLFETFYAVAINPHHNITQNPGCEWQLRMYSNKK